MPGLSAPRRNPFAALIVAVALIVTPKLLQSYSNPYRITGWFGVWGSNAGGQLETDIRHASPGAGVKVLEF